MHIKSILLSLGLVAYGTAQGSPFEDETFNITKALEEKGVGLEILSDIQSREVPSTYPGCPAACKALSALFSSLTYEQGSSEYEAFRGSYWSNQQAEVEPRCVFQPDSPTKLSIAILIFRLTDCSFAAKSGGHATFASASSIQDGIAISLKALNQIRLAEDRQTVAVGPGNKWQAVYETLEREGLTALGGRDGDVGVGGLTTGGGVSFFSSERGWACDNIASYEVVTASGIIVTASPESHPDLYWALRGGGNNFGIVTNFNLRTYPQDIIWGGARGWPEDKFPAVIEAFYALGVNSPSDPRAAAILSFSALPGELSRLAQVLLSYSVPEADPEILSSFAAIDGALYDSTQVRPVSNYTNNFATWPAGTRDEIWTHTAKLDVEHMTFIKDVLYDIATPLLGQVPTLRASVSFQHITQGMRDHMNQNGGNPLGLVDEEGPLLLMSQAYIWEDPAHDALIEAALLDFKARVQARAQQSGVAVDFVYMNYGYKDQDVVASYGPDNKKRLMKVAGVYDPKAVFQKLQPGYFKLEGAPVDNVGYAATF